MIRFLVIYKQKPADGMIKSMIPYTAELAIPILAGSEASAKTQVAAKMKGNDTWQFSRVVRDMNRIPSKPVKAREINNPKRAR